MSIQELKKLSLVLFCIGTICMGAALTVIWERNMAIAKLVHQMRRERELSSLIGAAETGYRYHAEGVSLQKLTNDVAAAYWKGVKP